MRFGQSIFIAAVAGGAAISAAAAQDARPVLTSTAAKAIVAGCEAYAKDKKWRLNITVLDQGRNLMAFLRMDDAPLGSIEISQWKANSSASFPRATKATADRALESPSVGFAPNIAVFEGGEAIFTKDGVHLGGVGVSGAAGNEDAECARAGIAAAGLTHARAAN